MAQLPSPLPLPLPLPLDSQDEKIVKDEKSDSWDEEIMEDEKWDSSDEEIMEVEKSDSWDEEIMEDEKSYERSIISVASPYFDVEPSSSAKKRASLKPSRIGYLSSSRKLIREKRDLVSKKASSNYKPLKRPWSQLPPLPARSISFSPPRSRCLSPPPPPRPRPPRPPMWFLQSPPRRLPRMSRFQKDVEIDSKILSRHQQPLGGSDVSIRARPQFIEFDTSVDHRTPLIIDIGEPVEHEEPEQSVEAHSISDLNVSVKTKAVIDTFSVAEIDDNPLDQVIVPMVGRTKTQCDEIIVPQQNVGARRPLIFKTMVSTGLIESITSLTIVTTAANARFSNGNVVALALTNLISGIFLITHHLAGLKKDIRKKERPKGYQEVLVDALHYLLHYTMALLSFLFFGLVPPLVYALTFRETDDKDLKLSAAAGASLLCIVLLAVARAHIQKLESREIYVKNIGYYVSFGLGALALAYLAGNLFGELIGKSTWFD